jgi:MoaA/NifB/PqqE/SkfB family radical SAM enzyme
MQGKIAHAAERKSFEIALDHVLKSSKGDERKRAIMHVIDIAEKLLDRTVPGAADGMREALYPGSKWERWLFEVIDETNPTVLRSFILNGGYESALRGLKTTFEMAEKYDCNVPWVILFDPTSACNKHCKGCWAAEYGNKLNLSYEDMDRLVTQGSELGCHFYMLTGGEPLVRKADILRLAQEHSDCVFNIFTNASLVDEAFCEDVQRAGNIVFSVSLESYEANVNDGRRGDGSFDEVMNAFELMRSYGLLFGTSTCYTRDNVERVTSDEFFDLIIEKGCRWAWFFHYMPVGDGASADLIPTVEQREYMLRRIREVRGFEGGKPIFAMDFQNDGEFVKGCIAGGRAYCHINARGDVEPCVFIHYSNANIKEQSLLECLQQPLFQAYRKRYPWNGNHLMPCPMLENPEVLPEMVHESAAQSTDYIAPESVESLCARTTTYAQAWEQEAERLWHELHPELPAGVA